MTDYFVIRIDISNGSGSPTVNTLSNILNGNLQLVTDISQPITKKWAASGFSYTNADEMAHLFHDTVELVKQTIVEGAARVYVDAITI